ncbi:cobalt/nickel transport system permease protein [Clostridium cavendishii DSM 21758]|uniref:Cobalt/nickel transport system permease protein n=1 Tax=Clostridium cavendishii DSM 21758 TaxID=1121302 RepID=A0A1M6BF72_9CLOT|nr:energy-coupling factor transporter transmembrane component T [Clostridium cavendishii]SHI47355.1 cobalt/nickel transport system permease protein [Clostridium cavendishii DSM 21758]
MPEWLLKKDDYVPPKDKDAFIDKSIISILGIVIKFTKQTEYRKKRVEINALVKLISTLILIAFISLTKNFTFVLVVTVFMLVLINFFRINEIKHILKVSLTVAVFTFIIFLPSIFLGYGNNILMITLKILVSVAFVNILAFTTQWNDLIGALNVFRVPNMFIFVLDITIKYILILGEFSLNMVYALKLRSVGKSNSKSTSISGIVGTMFIKSKEMAEEMHGAMECRGFIGEYKVYKKFKLKLPDYICIIFNLAFILMYFYFDRL